MMIKKKLIRLIAVCTACLSMSMFAFTGCKNPEPDTGNGDNTTDVGGGTGTGSGDTGTGSGDTGTGSGDTGTGSGDTGTGSGDTGTGTGTGKDPTKPSGPIQKPDDPVITEPVNGEVKILKASNEELETAYVTWEALENAKWYSVYYSVKDANSWTKLDGPLVRQYSDYYRADALGLKAGEYDMKVVPIDKDDKEVETYSSTAAGITVYAHERSGYGFYGASASGAYNDDGTLRSGAQVFYVTAATAKTITATVNKKGKPTEATGFQSIIDARQSSGDTTPLCFRIVGTVTKADLDHISSSSEGLQVKGTGDITIEGVGSDATIKDFGMLLRECKNVEVRNLGIVNCMDDGISIDTDNEHLWIHNNDIFYGKNGGGDKAKGDGALDTKGSTLITHSYNHFWDCGKCNLQGMKSEQKDYRITYHHNWYDHSDSRHPRIRTATVHIYNNYFDGNAKYGVGVTMGASAFVENNYFRSTATMKPMMSSLQGTDIAHGTAGQTFSGENGGMIKAYGNHFEGKYELLTQNNTDANNLDCYLATSRTEQVPDTYKTKVGGTTYSNFDTADDMYEYTVDTAEQAKVKVTRYAGRVDGGDLKWEFDNATEDSNYAIIPGLGTAVANYKGSVVKIGGGTASTTPGGNTGTGEGNGDGDNPPVTVDGEIKFVPSKSGSIFTVSGNVDSNSTAMVVDGVSIPAKSGLKLETSTSITFTLDKEMTITLYLSVGNIKIDDVKTTSTSTADGLSVITMKLSAGAHTLGKADKGVLYLIKLTPVS